MGIVLLRGIPPGSPKTALVFLLNGIFFASFFSTVAETLPILSMLTLGYVCLQLIVRFPSKTLLSIYVNT